MRPHRKVQLCHMHEIHLTYIAHSSQLLQHLHAPSTSFLTLQVLWHVLVQARPAFEGNHGLINANLFFQGGILWLGSH